jgi:hypothetical protein
MLEEYFIYKTNIFQLTVRRRQNEDEVCPVFVSGRPSVPKHSGHSSRNGPLDRHKVTFYITKYFVIFIF